MGKDCHTHTAEISAQEAPIFQRQMQILVVAIAFQPAIDTEAFFSFVGSSPSDRLAGRYREACCLLQFLVIPGFLPGFPGFCVSWLAYKVKISGETLQQQHYAL